MPKFDIQKLKKENERGTRMLMLNTTSDCTLKCAYCFEKKQPRTNSVMSFNLAKEKIAEQLEREDEYKEVIIDFFGGEPFLAFDLISNVVEWVKSKSWKKRYFFSIGTNGTILTEEMKKWLAENRKIMNVGLSFDGSKEAHNIGRDNSYDLVRANLPFFQDNWPNQPIKMTICAETIPYTAQSIIEMEKCVNGFTANVVMEDIWGTMEEKKRLLDIYADQLLQLVDFYTEHTELFPATILDRKPEYIRLKSDNDNEKNQEEVKRFCGAGHEMIFVDIDGKSYPCHRFSQGITQRFLPAAVQNHQPRWKPEECEMCKLNGFCPTCAGLNYEMSGDSSIRTTYHCDAVKLEVLASAKLYSNRIEQNPPDFEKLPQEEAAILQRRINGILELDKYGI